MSGFETIFLLSAIAAFAVFAATVIYVDRKTNA
jgi:hypothetical protein